MFSLSYILVVTWRVCYQWLGNPNMVSLAITKIGKWKESHPIKENKKPRPRIVPAWSPPNESQVQWKNWATLRLGENIWRPPGLPHNIPAASAVSDLMVRLLWGEPRWTKRLRLKVTVCGGNTSYKMKNDSSWNLWTYSQYCYMVWFSLWPGSHVCRWGGVLFSSSAFVVWHSEFTVVYSL